MLVIKQVLSKKPLYIQLSGVCSTAVAVRLISLNLSKCQVSMPQYLIKLNTVENWVRIIYCTDVLYNVTRLSIKVSLW